jgi:hypothetical protein
MQLIHTFWRLVLTACTLWTLEVDEKIWQNKRKSKDLKIHIVDKGTLFPWRRTAHQELSPISYNYVRNNTISSSPTTIFLLGTLHYYTPIVHNNTAVRSIHETVLFVGLKCGVPYCVNTHTMALGSTQLVTEMSTRNISSGVNTAPA